MAINVYTNYKVNSKMPRVARNPSKLCNTNKRADKIADNHRSLDYSGKLN